MKDIATPIDNIAKRQATLLDVYLKLVAIFLLMRAVTYWGRIVGYPDPQADFAAMELHWQVAVSVLAIFQPVTALGLWGNTYWGIATWVIVIITEVMMFAVFPQLFGFNSLLVLFHATSFGCFLLVALAIWFNNRARDRQTV